jgi:hypothetical protein
MAYFLYRIYTTGCVLQNVPDRTRIGALQRFWQPLKVSGNLENLAFFCENTLSPKILGENFLSVFSTFRSTGTSKNVTCFFGRGRNFRLFRPLPAPSGIEVWRIFLTGSVLRVTFFRKPHTDPSCGHRNSGGSTPNLLNRKDLQISNFSGGSPLPYGLRYDVCLSQCLCYGTGPSRYCSRTLDRSPAADLAASQSLRKSRKLTSKIFF